jgi:hypothetical protein
MKNIKVFFVLALLIFAFSSDTRSQSLNSKGFTIHTYVGMYMEDGEVKSYEVNEIYNVSFQDGLLIHNIFSGESVTNSQIYKISDLSRIQKEGVVSFEFDAISGISGKVYRYIITFESETAATLTLVQPDGSSTVFMAAASILKTFKQ